MVDEVAGHVSFLTLCVCVSIAFVARDSKRLIVDKNGVPEVNLDYSFIWRRGGKAEEEDSELVLVLIMREEHTKMTTVSVVTKKGAAQCLWQRWLFLLEIDLDKADFVMKSDQESAVATLLDDINAMRSGLRTVVK